MTERLPSHCTLLAALSVLVCIAASVAPHANPVVHRDARPTAGFAEPGKPAVVAGSRSGPGAAAEVCAFCRADTQPRSPAAGLRSLALPLAASEPDLVATDGLGLPSDPGAIARAPRAPPTRS